jgi:hypothetical protein
VQAQALYVRSALSVLSLFFSLSVYHDYFVRSWLRETWQESGRAGFVRKNNRRKEVHREEFVLNFSVFQHEKMEVF